jgi:hypothetical protein
LHGIYTLKIIHSSKYHRNAKIFHFLFLFSYASTIDFGYYSRLEQLQKRLWYFSYLKYPISSIYHYLTNSLKTILSSDQSSIVYSRPCQGCLRCKPSLLEQYHSSQQEPKVSFFSRIYQSNRSNIKPVVSQVLPPIENPDCGVEYCINIDKKPIQIWAQIGNDEHGFQVDVSDKFQRFNYNKEKYPKQSLNVQHIRFNPNIDLIPKQMLINHEKFLLIKTEEEENQSLECRIELTEKTFKFIQINNDLLLTKKPTKYELEEDALEKTGIFLFPRRHQHTQSS